MSEFFVGQKVVCVDDRFEGGRGDEINPKKGQLYTIREIYYCDYWDRQHVRLTEIKNPALDYSGGRIEPGWWFHRFKSLDSKAISIFRQIAKDVTEGRKVTVRA